MDAGSGKLKLTICEAKLTRDTEMLGKMDPYCVITYNGNKLKTATKVEAGKRPVWN